MACIRRVLRATCIVLASMSIAACVGSDGAAADETDIEALDPQSLHWITPLASDSVVIDEGFEVGVYTQNIAARVVHFAVDGHEIGACDPSQPEEDCRDDHGWYFSAEIATAGHHELSAWFDGANGARVATTRSIEVLATPPAITLPTDIVEEEPLPDDTAYDETEDESAHDDYGAPGADISPLILEGPGEIVDDAIMLRHHRSRGYLDPAHGFRRFGGGIEYRFSHERVLPRGGRIDGSASRACRCVRRYGDDVRAMADLRYVSRASVIAALVVGDNCDTDAGSVATFAFVRGRTCTSVARAALMPITPAPGHSAEWTCRQRMADTPRFAAGIIAGYLARPSVARRHQFDPPRMAAVISAGSVRRSSANRWHMYSRSDFVSRYVAAYNAYRTQEVGGDPPEPANFHNAYNARLPNPVGGNRARRTTGGACEGDLARHNAACTRWPITGNPPLRNGFGDERGVITDTYALINYGVRRTLGGVSHVYVFAAHTRNAAGETGLVSGWMPESAITDRSVTSIPTVTARDPGGTFTPYTLVGAAVDTSYFVHTPGLARDLADRKLRLAYTSGGSNASDYYVRRTWASEPAQVNVLFGLPGNGGVSSDTVPASTTERPVHFFAANGVPRVSSYLYQACSENSDARLEFVYGYVDTPDGRRFGWVASANLGP